MRVLVVGLGSMGKRRIRNLHHLGVPEVMGFDVRADRVAEAVVRYGIEPVTSLAEGLARRPDAMIISTPPDLHLPYALAAGRHGIHFFTEAGVSDEGLGELQALLRTQPSLVGVPSCTMRYQAGPRRVRRLLADDAVGRPLAFVYHVGQYLPDWHPWEDYRTYYVSRRATGACREIVPFELTWLTQAFGAVTSVLAITERLSTLDADIDDLYQCLLAFETGVRGFLQVDVLARAPVRHFRLLGTDGTVEWDAGLREIRAYAAATGRWTVERLAPGTVEPGYADWTAEEPYVEEMRDFLAAIRGERPFGYSFEDDGRILTILAAVENAAVGSGRATQVVKSTTGEAAKRQIS